MGSTKERIYSGQRKRKDGQRAVGSAGETVGSGKQKKNEKIGSGQWKIEDGQ